jgi:FecR protein
MSETGPGEPPGAYFDLVDLYCSGLIEDDDFRQLEAILLESEPARSHFVEYVQHHTEIHFAIRAGRAADAVLKQLTTAAVPPGGRERSGRRWLRDARNRWWIGAAASILLLVVTLAVARIGTGIAYSRRGSLAEDHVSPRNVAWLVNAQNCRWAGQEQKPSRDMQPGKMLWLERGLAEIEFDRGARLILQGPAGLELISTSSVRLHHGTLTARIPAAAKGFSVLTAEGKVVDLGTEFGLSVDGGGTTTVRVFKGEVEAFPLITNLDPPRGVTVHENQAAQIDGHNVALELAKSKDRDDLFVRSILPPPVKTPRVLSLDFSRPVPGTLLDLEGRGIGLSQRLPGTGSELPVRDPNLQLRPDRQALELTTTRSDLNTQERLPTGEYLGVLLSELGFTGREDFEISATILNIPGLKEVGQFGLYAGSRSDANIRGGLISHFGPTVEGLAANPVFRLFLVNNHKGTDADINEVGLITTGDDLRLTLRRKGGRYSLVVDNLTRNSSSSLEIPHPAFLDEERELHVGLFGANTQSDLRKTLTIRQLKVTVWTTQADIPTIAQSRVRR